MNKQEEILIDVDSPSSATDTETATPVKKLSFQTKFFCTLFVLMLIYHFVSSISSASQINTLNSKLRDADKQVSDLLLTKQGLELNLKNVNQSLDEAKSNIKYVESARQGSVDEVKTLTEIIAGFKNNLSEGKRLELLRLEGKLLEWEEYQKSVEAVLSKRPGAIGK